MKALSLHRWLIVSAGWKGSGIAIYVQNNLHAVVNLGMISTDAVNYTSVTDRIPNVGAEVVSVYVPPGVDWDPRYLLQVGGIAQRFCLYTATTMSIANHGLTGAWILAEKLSNVVVTMTPIVLNNGRSTFVRCCVRGSVLDLPYLPPSQWCLELGSYGSDHLPIRLLLNQTRQSMVGTLVSLPRMLAENNITRFTRGARWRIYLSAFAKLCLPPHEI